MEPTPSSNSEASEPKRIKKTPPSEGGYVKKRVSDLETSSLSVQLWKNCDDWTVKRGCSVKPPKQQLPPGHRLQTRQALQTSIHIEPMRLIPHQPWSLRSRHGYQKMLTAMETTAISSTGIWFPFLPSRKIQRTRTSWPSLSRPRTQSSTWNMPHQKRCSAFKVLMPTSGPLS